MVKIKGNDYVMVNERIKEFRANYKGWSLTSELISLNEESCVIKAIVTDENGVVKATGFAQEDKSSSMINKTSFVENCETSAWGRALGNLGIGIDGSICSAEEVDMAIKKQENIQKEWTFKGGRFNGLTMFEASAKEDFADYIELLKQANKFDAEMEKEYNLVLKLKGNGEVREKEIVKCN